MTDESKELADRRQRARIAYYDAVPPYQQESSAGALEEAIETATRVRITPEIVEAACAGWLAAEGSWTEHPGPRQVARLAAAFRAAGFEVER